MSKPRTKGRTQHKGQKPSYLEVRTGADQNQPSRTWVSRNTVSATTGCSCYPEGASRYMMAGKIAVASKTEAGQTAKDLKIKTEI